MEMEQGQANRRHKEKYPTPLVVVFALLFGSLLLVAVIFFARVTWKALFPPRSANVAEAIKSLQADITAANEKNPCIPVENATLEITVNATTTSKGSTTAGTPDSGASFSTEAEKVGENSNKLTIELVNNDTRQPLPSCDGYQKAPRADQAQSATNSPQAATTK